MVKKLGDFELTVEPGEFHMSQIIVLLGENGCGKTTFVRILAGKDKELRKDIPDMKISFKPQKIAPKFQGSVRDLLQARLGMILTQPSFKSMVCKPMGLDPIFDNQV